MSIETICDWADAEQELRALLALYQALRMAMTAAAESADADPDRASFTIALQAARDQVTAARGVTDSADPAVPAGSAVPSWLTCCPCAVRVTAPARSNAPPPAATSDQECPCQSVTITRQHG